MTARQDLLQKCLSDIMTTNKPITDNYAEIYGTGTPQYVIINAEVCDMKMKFTPETQRTMDLLNELIEGNIRRIAKQYGFEYEEIKGPSCAQ